MKRIVLAVFFVVLLLTLCGCSSVETDSSVNVKMEQTAPAMKEQKTAVDGSEEITASTSESAEMTDEEFATLQTVFAKALEDNSDFENELKYKPSYVGEWTGGKRYHTENYAYGQFVFDMDSDGYPHTITWRQDHVETWYGAVKRQGGMLVVYNRLEDADAPEFKAADDSAINIVDGVLGKYGREVTIPSKTHGEYTYVWYKIPTGTYTVTNEGNHSTVFVVGDASTEDVRDTIWLTENGETATITVDSDAHIETSSGTRISLTTK